MCLVIVIFRFESFRTVIVVSFSLFSSFISALLKSNVSRSSIDGVNMAMIIFSDVVFPHPFGPYRKFRFLSKFMNMFKYPWTFSALK